MRRTERRVGKKRKDKQGVEAWIEEDRENRQ